MIEEGFIRVSYRDSVGWARTREEAEEMEKTFKYRYKGGSFKLTSEDMERMYPPFGVPLNIMYAEDNAADVIKEKP